jgi:hypothetical protein
MSDWVRWETYVEAPKKLGFKSFLYDLNMKYGTELAILDHDKGFFRETIRFKFTGDRSKVAALREEYIQIVLETLEKYNQSTVNAETVTQKVNNKYSSMEKDEEKTKDSNNFVGEYCRALSAEVTYSNNHVEIDIWTRHTGQDDQVHALAESIKKHFGIDYKIIINEGGLVINVSGNEPEIKLFADTLINHIDWKIEPIINNEPSVAKRNKM